MTDKIEKINIAELSHEIYTIGRGNDYDYNEALLEALVDKVNEIVEVINSDKSE